MELKRYGETISSAEVAAARGWGMPTEEWIEAAERVSTELELDSLSDFGRLVTRLHEVLSAAPPLVKERLSKPCPRSALDMALANDARREVAPPPSRPGNLYAQLRRGTWRPLHGHGEGCSARATRERERRKSRFSRRWPRASRPGATRAVLAEQSTDTGQHGNRSPADEMVRRAILRHSPTFLAVLGAVIVRTLPNARAHSSMPPADTRAPLPPAS